MHLKSLNATILGRWGAFGIHYSGSAILRIGSAYAVLCNHFPNLQLGIIPAARNFNLSFRGRRCRSQSVAWMSLTAVRDIVTGESEIEGRGCGLLLCGVHEARVERNSK